MAYLHGGWIPDMGARPSAPFGLQVSGHGSEISRDLPVEAPLGYIKEARSFKEPRIHTIHPISQD